MIKGAARLGLLLLAMLPAATPPAQAAGAIRVQADSAVQIAIAEAAATVLIANPEIADVVALKSGQVLLVGRRPGRTDLLVMSASGKQLLARPVVVAPAGGALTLNRGAAERTLSCTPVCTEPAPPPPAGQ